MCVTSLGDVALCGVCVCVCVCVCVPLPLTSINYVRVY